MNKENLLHLFEYHREAGILIWKNPPKQNSYLIGQVAGTKQFSNGVTYLRVAVNGKKVFVHKVIYFLECEVLENILDHVDGNGLNNRIENLRKVSNRENSQNKKVHRAGALVGANWDKSRKKWFSSIQINGKTKYLGRFNSQTEAHQKYMNALKELE